MTFLPPLLKGVAATRSGDFKGGGAVTAAEDQ